MKRFKFLTALFALLCSANLNADEAQRGIATLDWTVAETLLALGEPPVAVGDVSGYQKWVAQPALPQAIIDLGLRNQPNPEQIATLSFSLNGSPLLFINSSFYASVSSSLQPFARVEIVDFYQAGDAWQNVVNATHRVAELIDKPQSAVQLMENFSQKMTALRAESEAFTDRPIALVQFIDTRHLRIYAENSPFGAVLTQLGFSNAWQGSYNQWGFETINITQLVKLAENSRFVVVKPYPSNIATALSHNTLWQHLPMSKNTLVLPAIWTFGGIPSAQRFAESLVNALKNGGEKW